MELQEIIKVIRGNNITAYEIAKNSLLTEVGINKIINGSSINPRKTTLKALEYYIINYVNGSQNLRNNKNFNILAQKNRYF